MAARKKQNPDKKPKKPKKEPKDKKPDTSMIIRRNAAPSRAKTVATDDRTERTAMTTRVEEMSGSHVVAGIGAGTLANAFGVLMVGKGWIGPKLTAGLLMGAGVATTAAGWYWEMDHKMAAGAGVAAAGTFSMTNQVAVDAYVAMEERAAEKRKKTNAEKQAKEREQRLADARALLAEEKKKKQRNGRRIVVLDQNGDPIHEYAAHATA